MAPASPRLWKKCNNKILEKCRKAACIFAHGSKQAPSAGGSKQAVVIPRLRLLLRLSSLHRMLLITLHKTQWHGGNQKKCIRLWQLMAPTKKFTDARLDLAKASLQYCLMEEILHQICKISQYLQGFNGFYTSQGLVQDYLSPPSWYHLFSAAQNIQLFTFLHVTVKQSSYA